MFKTAIFLLTTLSFYVDNNHKKMLKKSNNFMIKTIDFWCLMFV